MVWVRSCCVAAAMALATASLAQDAAPDLTGGGAYDTVHVAGFLLPIADVRRLAAARVLALNPDTGRFGFDPRITSEAALRRALRPLALEDARAVRDLYRSAKVARPNNVAHTLTIPSGYGPAYLSNEDGRPVLGFGLGGTARAPYSDSPDGGAAISLGFGNGYTGLGGTVSLSANDLSDVTNTDRVSLGFQLNRYITDGLSVAVGGENLLVRETDSDESFYVVGSWAFTPDTSPLPFSGVATLGAGTGRFADNTPADIAAGKRRHGTSVFGGIAWHVAPDASLIADWNGRNLSVGTAFRIPRTGMSVRLGVSDLTDRSGDGVRIIGSVGIAVLRF